VGDLQFDLRHPLPVYLSRNSAPLFTTDFNILPQFRALWETEAQDLERLKANLFLPMKASGDLIGIVAMGPKKSGRAYSAKEQEQMALLANLAALTIAYIYTRTSEKRWQEEAQSMRQAIFEITTDYELEEALSRSLAHLKEVFPCDSACILRAEKDHLVVAAAIEMDSLIGLEIPAQENELFHAVQQEKQAVVVEDTHADPRFTHYPGLPILTSWMGLPLKSQGVVNGMLVLNGSKPETFRVNPARLELVQALADSTAIMIEKAHLFQVERQQHQMAEALRHLGSEIGSTADYDQVLEFLLDRICQAMPADITLLFLADGSQFQLAKTRISENLDFKVADASDLPEFEAAAFANLHYLMNSSQPRVIPDTTRDPEWVQDTVDIRSWAGVQVMLDGQVAACFTFSSLTQGMYPPENSQLLSVFAEQAAMALHNFRLSNQVIELTTHDDLTGVFNRRHLLDLGEREFRRARRFQRQLSVAIIDVDNFHTVNETYGVDAGNQVLRAVADVFKTNIRLVDVLGRINGEEFALILTETDQPGALIISDRLRQLIASSPIITTTGRVKITVSMGVAIMDPTIPHLDSLLSCARAALEQAQQAGRNRVQIYQRPASKPQA
jgi:diguanylate cyclase (GGDEF)-like protein